MKRFRALLERLLPRSALGQITIIIVVSVVVVIVAGRGFEAVRKSAVFNLGDADSLTERVEDFVKLMRKAPDDRRAELVAWANELNLKLELLEAADVAALEARGRPPGAFRRLLHDLFPPDQPLPPESDLLSVDGKWVLVVPVDNQTSLLVNDFPNQVVTNDVAGPISYYVLALVVLLVLLRTYSRQAFLGPLARLSEEAKRANGLEGLRFHVDRGSLEVQALTQSLNEMQDRVRDLVRARTRMLRSVSHDLRTPLTRLRQRAERMEDGELRQKMLSDIQHIDALVEETLDYMRIDVSGESKERIDVASLLQTIQADFADMGANVVYEGSDHLVALAKPNALVRAITNLCDNGLRYGHVVKIALSGDDQWISIAVSDDGPGIPEEMRSHVVKPFFKLDAPCVSDERDADGPKSAGLGLGLSIVSEIVAAHEGTLHLGDSEAGGLLVLIKLPGLDG
ncbi:ATP-binding protein [Amorphus sp. 3PC139-8]|uniref:ATP-binding protein n=1 Tax=Amorphus sp. 3PC139-8 TaxID=2735676 RepID=UPI00345D01C9